ncbi:hypothetical protein HDE_06480 [Halotydeus destructor]|nr:hypothetical protein HDE_06480 [Halotydeus destructor]
MDDEKVLFIVEKEVQIRLEEEVEKSLSLERDLVKIKTESLKEVENLRSRIRKLSEEKLKSQGKIFADDSQVWRLRFEESQAKVEQLTTCNSRLNWEAEMGLKMFQEKVATVKNKENQINMLKENNKSLKVKLQALPSQETLAKLQKENANLKKEKHRLENKLHISNQDAEEDQAELMSLQAQLVVSGQTLTRLRSQMKGSEKRINKLKTRLEDERHGHETAMETFLMNINAMQISKSQVWESSSEVFEKNCPVCLLGHSELDSNGTRVMALAGCGHVLCASCLESQSRVKMVCPMCQSSFKRNQMIVLYFS